MKYMLYRIRRLLWVNKKVYGLIVLELAVGVAILVTCLNLLMTNESILERHQEQMAENEIVIYHHSTGRGNEIPESRPLPVGYEDYKALEEKFGDSLDIYYGAVYDASVSLFLYQKVSKLDYAWFIFMNDTMFEDLFSFERKEDCLYVGSSVYEFLEKASDTSNYNLICVGAEEVEQFDPGVYSTDKVNTVCHSFRFVDGQFQLSEDHLLGYEPIPNEEATPYIYRLSMTQYSSAEEIGARMYIEDCIIGSADMLPWLSEDYESLDSILQVQYLEDAKNPGAVPVLVNWLNKERKEDSYEFVLTDSALTMEKFSGEMNARIIQCMAISIAIMAVVLIGTVGILLVLLHRRKKSMAVAYCCGATRGKSYMELMGEVASVFLVGGAIGLVISAAVTPNLTALESRADFYPVNIALVAVFCIAAALLCCIIALAGIDDKEPMKNLKEL